MNPAKEFIKDCFDDMIPSRGNYRLWWFIMLSAIAWSLFIILSPMMLIGALWVSFLPWLKSKKRWFVKEFDIYDLKDLERELDQGAKVCIYDNYRIGYIDITVGEENLTMCPTLLKKIEEANLLKVIDYKWDSARSASTTLYEKKT